MMIIIHYAEKVSKAYAKNAINNRVMGEYRDLSECSYGGMSKIKY